MSNILFNHFSNFRHLDCSHYFHYCNQCLSKHFSSHILGHSFTLSTQSVPGTVSGLGDASKNADATTPVVLGSQFHLLLLLA